MTPRRLAAAVAQLAFFLLVTFVTINRWQRRALAEALVADFATLDTWSVEGHGTRFDNGFACFIDRARGLTHDELIRLKDLSLHSDHDTLADAGSLMAWAEDSRSCNDARRFSPVEGLRSYPTNAATDFDMLDTRLFRLVAFDVAQKLDAGSLDEAAEECVEIAEHFTVRTHLSLLSNMVAWMGVRVLSTPCASAWSQMSATTRERLHHRIEGLPAALAPTREWLRREQIVTELLGYGATLTSEERSRLPELAFPPFELGASRLTAPSVWARSHQRFDALIALADTPGSARKDASEALDEAYGSWLLGGADVSQSANYERFLERRDDVQRALVLLSDIAAHRAPTLPPDARIADGGVIWQLDADHALFFPQ